MHVKTYQQHLQGLKKSIQPKLNCTHLKKIDFLRHKTHSVAFPPHGPKDRFKVRKKSAEFLKIQYFLREIIDFFFQVVKIVTSLPMRRGRWSIVDYPDKEKDKTTTSTTSSSTASKDVGPPGGGQTQQQMTSASVPASIVPPQPSQGMM